MALSGIETLVQYQARAQVYVEISCFAEFLLYKGRHSCIDYLCSVP
jgi:hypothetical protein